MFSKGAHMCWHKMLVGMAFESEKDGPMPEVRRSGFDPGAWDQLAKAPITDILERIEAVAA